MRRSRTRRAAHPSVRRDPGHRPPTGLFVLPGGRQPDTGGTRRGGVARGGGGQSSTAAILQWLGTTAAAAQHPATSSRRLRSSGDRAAYWIKFQRGALRCWRRIVLNLWWHAYIRAAQVGWVSYVVVAMRLMRLAVGGALAQREAQRMVAERVTVLAEAQTAAAAKMITGRGMAAATKSASAVYRRKVRANQRRLARS